MFVPNHFIANKPENGLLEACLVDSANFKGSGDCFGTEVVKRSLRTISVPCLCVYTSGATNVLSPVYMLSEVQKESSIPEHIRVV